MIENLVLRLLPLFPRGLTNEQLIWRLTDSGLRPDASSLLAALTRLGERGEIRRDGNRWYARSGLRNSHSESADSGNLGARQAPPLEILYAVPATLNVMVPVAADGLGENGTQDEAEPQWSAALRYYAATQRQDPRGSVERFPDQHATGWQLFTAEGRWWQGAELRVAADQLPGQFRESLAHGEGHGTAALGWPIGVSQSAVGSSVLPAILVPVVWQLSDHMLTVTPEDVTPTLNPAWVDDFTRRTRWQDDELHDYLFQDDDPATLDSIALRLANATAAGSHQSVLRPAAPASRMLVSGAGLQNVLGLFLPDAAAFTRRVSEDLEVMSCWSPEYRAACAAAHLMRVDAVQPASEGVPTLVAEHRPLSDPQFVAADAALRGHVTVIQGPPGTGKSVTIVTLLCSALAAGQSVLFVSRNHQALDEVEGRMARLFPVKGVFTRGRDAEGARDNSFTSILSEIVEGHNLTEDSRLVAESAAESLRGELSQQNAHRRYQLASDRLNLVLSELADGLIAAADEQATVQEAPHERGSWLLRFVRHIARALRSSSAGAGRAGTVATAATEARRRIAQLRVELDALGAPPEALQEGHVPELLRHLMQARVLPGVAAQDALRRRERELKFGSHRLVPSALTEEDARDVLRFRPIWAVSTLSVPARVPLFAGLFDLAIFDEASQCDIASALPVLARAKAAVVVGDPQQLSFIPQLGRAREHALMDAQGMPKSGRAHWAQSINSLYDFVAFRGGADRIFLLRDQLRSAPGIVDYTSATFYGGRLRSQRYDEDFRPPAAYRPGLCWVDVKSRPAHEVGGNVNRAEADEIVRRVAELAQDATFDGSVGVVSPFRAQVAMIRRECDQVLTAPDRKKLRLHVDTVDRWQGGEADVVFFSLVVGRGAPASGMAFLSRERRRFNVAISRARAVVVVVGDLNWALNCSSAHISLLAEWATRPSATPPAMFDSRWERVTYEALLGRGLEPKPQYPVGSRRLDFALFSGTVQLDLEVDGRRWHEGPDGGRRTPDRLRDRELIARGWKVRRFWVAELHEDMEKCLDIVERDLEQP